MAAAIKLHIAPLCLCLMREYYDEFGITRYSMSLIQGEIEVKTDEILVTDEEIRVIKPLTP